MSFILDALRKSENERQRQSGPGLAELRPAMARPTLPIWAIAIAALLAINLVVLAVLMLNKDDAGAPAVATVLEPQIPTPPPVLAPQRASELPAVDRSVAPAPAPPQTESYARSEEEFEESVDFATEEPEAAGPELQPPPRANTASEDDGSTALPTMNDVTLAGTPLPELHLDIHVYATQAAERFVFLNNRKYREGSETPEGTMIERITRDGVVLNHRGVRFLLPRQ